MASKNSSNSGHILARELIFGSLEC